MSFNTLSYSSKANNHSQIPLAAELAFSTLLGLKTAVFETYYALILLMTLSGILSLSKLINVFKNSLSDKNFLLVSQ